METKHQLHVEGLGEDDVSYPAAVYVFTVGHSSEFICDPHASPPPAISFAIILQPKCYLNT